MSQQRTGARSHNQLNDRQKFQLWETLRGLVPEIQAEGPHPKVLAERLTRELGFKITLANVENAVEAGVIPSWEVKSRKARKPLTPFQRLKARVKTLEAALNGLCQQLGVQPPQESLQEADAEEEPPPASPIPVVHLPEPIKPVLVADPYARFTSHQRVALRNPVKSIEEGLKSLYRHSSGRYDAHLFCMPVDSRWHWVVLIRHISATPLQPGEKYRSIGHKMTNLVLRLLKGVGDDVKPQAVHVGLRGHKAGGYFQHPMAPEEVQLLLPSGDTK